MVREELEKNAKKLADELKISADKLIVSTIRSRMRKVIEYSDIPVYGVDELASEAINAFYPPPYEQAGYTTRFNPNGKILMFRPSELSLWTGISGHGKSQLLNQVALDCIESGAKVCIISLEMRPRATLKRLGRQITTLQNPSEEYIRFWCDYYAGKLFILDHVGSIDGCDLFSWMKDIRLFFGVDVFIIDSLMKCGMKEDDYNEQAHFVDNLAAFKDRYNCHIHLVAHPRKGASENDEPGKLDIKGTGTITNMADNCFSVWRNKKKEEKISEHVFAREPVPDQLLAQSDCRLICSKTRDIDSQEFFCKLWFNPVSLQYTQRRFEKSHIYVPFSIHNQSYGGEEGIVYKF